LVILTSTITSNNYLQTTFYLAGKQVYNFLQAVIIMSADFYSCLNIIKPGLNRFVNRKIVIRTKTEGEYYV